MKVDLKFVFSLFRINNKSNKTKTKHKNEIRKINFL